MSLTARYPVGLLVVIAWAICIRIVHLVGFFGESPFADTLVSDAYVFESWAARIASGDWIGEPRLFVLPPLYPYLVGIIYTLFGRNPDLIVILQSILGVVGSGLIWRLASRRYGQVAGVASGILFASTNTVLFYESMLVGTSSAVFLMVLALHFLDDARERGATRPIVCAGLCFGLLALVRPNFLLVIPVALVLIVWPYRRTRQAKQILIAFGMAALVPLGLVMMRNGIAAGEWSALSTHGGINFYMGNHAGAPGWFSPPPGMRAAINPNEPEVNLAGPRRLAEAETGRAMTDAEVSDYWFGRGMDFILSDPTNAIGLTLRKVRLFLTSAEIPLNYNIAYHQRYSAALAFPVGRMWVLFPLALIALILLYRSGGFAYDWLLIAAAYAASVILFHVSTRYRMPVVPILAILSGYSVQVVCDRVSAKDWGRVAWVSGAAGVLAFAAYTEGTAWEDAVSPAMDPYNLGTTHLFAGTPALALPYLAEAERIGGRLPGLHYNLGLTYSAVGRGDDAIRSYGSVPKDDPAFASARTNLGNIHFQAGRYAKAEAAYREAITADPNAHNARAALGWVHFTFHRNDSARTTWEAVLASDPENQSAVAGIQRLQSLK